MSAVEPRIRLRLYVLEARSHSRLAVSNLEAIRLAMGPGVELEVVDVARDPDSAERDKVLATPTLLRLRPGPVRRIVGDLSDRGRVLRALDLERNVVTMDTGEEA